jgi:hypothetical protein
MQIKGARVNYYTLSSGLFLYVHMEMPFSAVYFMSY